MGDLEELIRELYRNEESDCDGDKTCRVHIETAEELINKAYSLGFKEGVNGGR